MSIQAIIVLIYLLLRLIGAALTDGDVSVTYLRGDVEKPYCVIKRSFYRSFVWLGVIFGVLYTGGFFNG